MPDIFISEDKVPGKEKKSKLHTKKIETFDPEGMQGHTHNPLAAFCYYPHNVDFINQEPDEKVILLVRRHFITNLGWLALVAVMIVAPSVLSVFPLLDFLPARFQLAAILVWYLLTLAIFIQGFLSWFFSVNIITNKRVIDVDFENLIYRKITDAEIDKIEDATVQMGSVIRTLFDYGDVLIQTAAEIPEIEFEAVPHPDRIDKILSDVRLDTR